MQDVRNYGMSNGKPAIVLHHPEGARRQHHRDGASACARLLPRLQASIPQAIDLEVISDRTPTIRASLREVERAMAIAVGLGDPGGAAVPAQLARDAAAGHRGAGVAGRHRSA